MNKQTIRRSQDVVCFSSIDWQFIWQGHQEIMSALAARGSRVLFVENTGERAPSIRDIPRLRQRRTGGRGPRVFGRVGTISIFTHRFYCRSHTRLLRVVSIAG